MKIFRHIVGLPLFSLSCIGMYSASLASDITVFEGDNEENFSISGDPETEDIYLYFGDTLSTFLKWNTDTDIFEFSHDISLGGNELLDMRIENSATPLECNADFSGRLYFNTTDLRSYVCNGLIWKQIDEEHVSSTIPYLMDVEPSSIQAGSTNTLTITGGGFSPETTVVVPGMIGTIDVVEIISPSQLEITLSPEETNKGGFDILIQNNDSSNLAWGDNGVDVLEITSDITLIPQNTGGTTLWERKEDVITDTASLFPASVSQNWERGASFGTVPEDVDFILSFTPAYMPGVSSGGNAFFGMDTQDPNHEYSTIDYSFFIVNGSSLYIYENGQGRGSVGSFEVGDVLSLIRENNQIKYVVNGSVVYTSDIVSTESMVFDSTLYRYLGAEDISLVY